MRRKNLLILSGVSVWIIGLVAFMAFALQAHAQTSSSQSPQSEADSDLEAKGVITVIPTSTLYGLWVVGGQNYEAVTGTTQFKQGHGALMLNTCAEVRYELQADKRIAKEIKSDDGCGLGDDDNKSGLVETKGTIESFPAGLVGEWRVSGITYTAVTTTYFKQSERPFATGICVEIKHPISSTAMVSIKTEESRDCGGSGSSENKTGKAKGVLQDFPATLTGTWTVNSVTYQVVTSTTLDRSHGDFYVGGCVEVRYNISDTNRTAFKVETESPDDCGVRSSVTPTLEARGFISSTPSTGTLFGTWVIGSNTYDAISGTTTFKQEHGSLAAGECAKVKYFVQGGVRVATRIESEELHDCGKPEDKREFYGAVEALPGTADYVGAWVVGGRSISVTAATGLSQGPFTIGMIVEIKYYRSGDGSLIAIKIEGKHSSSDKKKEGKAYGILQSRPATPTVVGTWVVASITYSITNDTRLTGPLAIGDCLEVHYRVDANGARMARKLKTESASDCSDTNARVISRTYGFVEQMPPSGFVGTWVIGGVSYDARALTKFEQKRGALNVGAFVEVKYRAENGVNAVLALETHIPPQAGAINLAGVLSANTVANTPEGDAQTWYLNGQPVTLIGATFISDAAGALAAGRKVLVNAYTDASTSQTIATQITVVGDQAVYLPFAQR